MERPVVLPFGLQLLDLRRVFNQIVYFLERNLENMPQILVNRLLVPHTYQLLLVLAHLMPQMLQAPKI
jgi:hypothetical protein